MNDKDSAASGGIWIQGAGELASGVAWRLFRSGYRVVMAEIVQPVAIRRLVCFSEAVYAGQVTVEGVQGFLSDPSTAGFRADAVTVCVDQASTQVTRLQPDAVVDARMTKQPPQSHPGVDIPVIGLGPGFRCGRDVKFVVETHREARMGSLLRSGEAATNTGVPGVLGGETHLRLLRAPAEGRLLPRLKIGDLVVAGETVAQVGGQPLKSNIDGLLRGLIHPEVELSAGDKVGDVDPRGAAVDPGRISDKSLAVAGGVLEGLLVLNILPHR
jgi:xanthine dehydrogenase accessory factor